MTKTNTHETETNEISSKLTIAKKVKFSVSHSISNK